MRYDNFRRRPPERKKVIGGSIPGKSLKMDAEKDIVDIWGEQIRLKQETEHLEIAYKAAKEQAKAIKSALRSTSYGNSNLLIIWGKLVSSSRLIKLKFIRAAKINYVKLRLAKYKLTKRPQSKLDEPQIKTNLFNKTKLMYLLPVIIILASILIWQNQRPPENNNTSKVNGAETVNADPASSAPTNVTPIFNTILPEGKTIEVLGGFALVSPPDKPAAYAFLDIINDIKIKVTQQQAPDNLISNPDNELKTIAADFNANNLLPVDDRVAYVGQSIKGPQSVIFYKNDLLILIVSEQKVDDQAWIKYLSSLK